jgi:hypothetical protein
MPDVTRRRLLVGGAAGAAPAGTTGARGPVPGGTSSGQHVEEETHR